MSYSQKDIQRIWAKGKVVGDKPNEWRQDDFGAWIGFSAYGKRGTPYGWEVDHIEPKEQGGADVLSNLRPLQWLNNVNRSVGKYTHAVWSESDHNVGVCPFCGKAVTSWTQCPFCARKFV